MFNWLKNTFSKHADEYCLAPLMPRAINISGVTVQFSMPENFSPDMPGDDLIEQVDLKQYSELSPSAAIPLMKRWWDFYSGKPSSKNTIGTLMLSLDILPKPKNIEGSLFEYTPMGDAVFNGLQGFSSEDGALLPSSQSELNEFNNNGANWIVAGIGYEGREADRTNIYSVPLSESWYFRAIFILSSDKNSGLFLKRALGEQMRILESFTLKYSDDIPTREPVEIALFEAVSKEEQEAFRECNKKHSLE